MDTKKIILIVLGFLFAGTGIIAIILSLVGLQLTFLAWADQISRLFGFALKICLLLAGIIIIYMNLTDFQREEA